MLDMTKLQYTTDIIHETIPYSGIEHEVISTPIYNRLHKILQSSLVFLTYPSNKVKRFEHSLGTMHLAGKIFFNSICNSDEDDLNKFMEQVSSELIAWRKNINFNKYSFTSKELRNKYDKNDILKAPIPDSDFYNMYCPKFLCEEYKFQYYVVFQAVRLAGLLHDVGHLPYSHILEHAFKSMYNQVNSKEHLSEAEKEFINILNRFMEGKDEIHEEIGKLLVNDIRNSIVENITDKTDPNIYFFIAVFSFAEKILCSKPIDNNIYSDLHTIVSSVVDADRLDYCTRDAYCSGIDNSIFQYKRLLLTYKLKNVEEDGNDHFCFCPSTKAFGLVENLLQRRYKIFSDINYHHRVHKHEILLEEVICSLGIEELDQIKNVADILDSPIIMPFNVSSIWKLISKLNDNNAWNEYQIIQLDDSWLDTLLKNNFFNKYGEDYLSLRINGNDILWNKFDELISATKRYCSFFKRTTDFRKFDKLFYKYLECVYNRLKPYYKEKIVLLKSYNDFFEENRSFVFNYCFNIFFLTKKQQSNAFDEFESMLNDEVKKCSELKINDCILRSCLFSLGYDTAKTPLYLWEPDETCIKIEQVSSQLNVFQQYRALAPIFHLYYLPNFNIKMSTYDEVNTEILHNILAKAAIQFMFKISIDG